MRTTSYINAIVDGYWKVIDSKPISKGHNKFLLENTYNGTKVEMWDKTFYDIRDCKTSVSRVVSRRIKHETKKLSNRFY